jgi:hypothetical protein
MRWYFLVVLAFFLSGCIPPAATTPVPTNTPQSFSVIVSQDNDCSCNGEVTSVYIFFAPVGGIPPYHYKSSSFDLVSDKDFEDSYSFVVNPGDEFLVVVKSSDSQIWSGILTVPASCTPTVSCTITPAPAVTSTTIYTATPTEVGNGGESTTGGGTIVEQSGNGEGNTNGESTSGEGNTDEGSTDDGDTDDDDIVVDVCVEPNEHSNKCKK